MEEKDWLFQMGNTGEENNDWMFYMAKKFKMEDQPSKESIQCLIKYIEYLRKKFEKEENYEVCSEMRDYIKLFSDYILGYKTYKHIETELYDLCCADGDVEYIDERDLTVVFKLSGTGQLFTFKNISFQEICRLQLLVASLPKRKK